MPGLPAGPRGAFLLAGLAQRKGACDFVLVSGALLGAVYVIVSNIFNGVGARRGDDIDVIVVATRLANVYDVVFELHCCFVLVRIDAFRPRAFLAPRKAGCHGADVGVRDAFEMSLAGVATARRRGELVARVLRARLLVTIVPFPPLDAVAGACECGWCGG